MHKDIYQSLPVFRFGKTIKDNTKKKEIRATIFGNFGAMNSGDEAILSGQVEELRTVKGIKITVAGIFPQLIQRHHKTKAIKITNVKNVITTIFSSDVVIFGGGGLFCKIDTGIRGFIFQMYLLFILLSSFLLRKPVFVLGLGFYSNTNFLIYNLAFFLLRFAKIVTVRDYHSYQFLREHKVNVQIYKDNSFLMKQLNQQTIKTNYFFKSRFNAKRVNIGIVLKTPENINEEEKLLTEVSKFVTTNQANADFWFYSLDTHTSYQSDYEFGEKLLQRLRSTNTINNIYFIPTDWNPQVIFSSFQLMDFIISMRLHGLIFSYRNNVPFIGITYDEKCTSFLKSIGKIPHKVEDISEKILQRQLENSLQVS